jgi:hypothetical protein
MKSHLVSLVVLGLILGLSAEARADTVINVKISPQTVNLQFQGEWVTVHTNIAYTLVLPDSVALDGFSADIEKYDDRGYLVAKFKVARLSEYLRGFLDAGSATLTLTGVTLGGDSFSGSDTVRVIDQAGKRGK